MSVVVKEKKDSGINVNPVTQPGVASKSDEDLSVSNAAESLSDLFRIRGSIRRGNSQDRAPGAVVHGHYADTCS